MRIEELIGLRIRGHRERLGLTQEQLGRRLGGTLDREWTRQAVSAAEKGDRAFTAAELLAVVLALGVSISALLVAPASVGEVELSAGTSLTSDELAATARPREGAEGAPQQARATLRRLAKSLDDMRAGTDLAAAQVATLFDQIDG